MGADAELLQLAARQLSLVTTTQLAELGLSEAQVGYRVSAGRLRRVRLGVLAVGGVPQTWEQAVMAGVLAAGSGAVASHFCAALLWAFPDVLRDVGIEITTDRPDQRRLRGVRTHRTVKFLSGEHTVLRGIPVTTVARTLVDCSCLMSPIQLARAMDAALRKHETTLPAIRTCVSGLPPAPGRRPSVIKELLARRLDGYHPGDSDSEVRLMRALVQADLPEPVLQHPVRLDGHRYVIDLAYPHLKLAIEYDGFEWHNSRSAFDRDRQRANHLTAEGWTVLRFTSEMTDVEVVRTVRATLGAVVG
jgi:very-short-patch-repair endonuclease